MPSPIRRVVLRFAAFFIVVFFSASATVSCARKADTGERTQAESAATETVKPIAVVEPSAGPRWFELSADGPVAIGGPAVASLTPFEPWPLARRVAGFVVREGLIAAGANRDGFVGIVARKDGKAAVYRASDPELCGPYSIGSVFTFNGTPAALLYRDRFFVDPEAPAAFPNVVTLVAGNPKPVSVELGALASYSGSDGWDVESMERAANGKWHFRVIRAKDGGGETAYLVADGLYSAATPSTAAAFRNAREPRSIEEAEPVLRRALADAALLLNGDDIAVVTALSPGQESVAYYLLAKAAGAEIADDVARAWACSDGARAYVAFADGRLSAAIGRDGPILRTRLPALPQGYVYTGLAATGGLLVAAWEEQDVWAVGAAGFVILSSELSSTDGGL